jgi:anti-sigma factor RsiW
MGDLSAGEERKVEEHLKGCASCRREAESLRLAHKRLIEFAAVAEMPPPHLKDRAVTEMAPRASRWRASRWRVPTWAAAAAVCVLAVLGLALTNGLSDLFASETTVTTLQSTRLAPGAGGELRVETSATNARAELEAWDLPQLEEDEYYELWFGKGEGRVSAGTFTVDEGGQATCRMSVPQETVGGYQRVGITREKFPVEPRMDSAKAVLVGEFKDV